MKIAFILEHIKLHYKIVDGIILKMYITNRSRNFNIFLMRSDLEMKPKL